LLTDPCAEAGYARFAAELADFGVWVAARGNWYVSAVHGQREFEAALERAEACGLPAVRSPVRLNTPFERVDAGLDED
jgi:hypothetical protein